MVIRFMSGATERLVSQSLMLFNITGTWIALSYFSYSRYSTIQIVFKKDTIFS